MSFVRHTAGKKAYQQRAEQVRGSCAKPFPNSAGPTRTCPWHNYSCVWHEADPCIYRAILQRNSHASDEQKGDLWQQSSSTTFPFQVFNRVDPWLKLLRLRRAGQSVVQELFALRVTCSSL